MRRATLVLVLSLLALTARAQGQGTLTLHGHTASAGAGFTWGAGTLQFQGKTYPVRIDGFVIGAVGSAEIDATGTVTGLTKAEDLNGDYTSLAAGGAFGEGGGKVVMRNDKGVRIELDATGSGVQFGLGPRGDTLEVGPANGPPADASARLPQTLGFGEVKAGPLYIRPTLNAQLFWLLAANPGFNGSWSFGPIDRAGNYLETSNEEGVDLRLPLGDESEYGLLTGRVSGVYSATTSAPDMPACVAKGSVDAYTLESAYLKWQSGGLFPKLGENAIELSGGNQNYQVFDGLLFWDGGQDCVGRGANWLSPRKAFEGTGLVRFNLKGLTLEAVHLKYNDHPSSGTSLWGERIEWSADDVFGDVFLKHIQLGFMYFHIYDSRNPARDGMNGYYVYTDTAPIPALPDFSFKATYVRETNDDSSGLSSAYAWYAAPFYKLSQVPWTPTFSYRYAFFSGGGTHAFDALFTGLPDWGYWFQGEVLGEAVLSDSNLVSHQVRMKLEPNDWLAINLIYYRFLLDNRAQSFGVTPTTVRSHALADEVDLIFDVKMTNWWSITATAAMANPNSAFIEAVDGHGTWVNGYLYTTFNF